MQLTMTPLSRGAQTPAMFTVRNQNSTVRLGAPRPGLNIVAKRKWVKQECKPNSKPVLKSVHVNVGDTVQVIQGKDKGVVSEVLSVNRKTGKITVKDVNVKTKHIAPQRKGETGSIVKMNAMIDSSNVLHYSTTQKVASRVGARLSADGTRKEIYLKKTGEVLRSWLLGKAKKEAAAAKKASSA
mmetsp:Transcript_3614/g.12961  ORF Transcript_3614/g.12961 Transcript_3614/m.12961 type:complete len:184 (-) Transcript_3614:324-875(-)